MKIAKEKWSRGKAELVHNMGEKSKIAWKAAKEIMAGELGHAKKTVKMSLRMANGELARTPEQNLEVAYEHFHKQYNLRRPFDPEAAKLIEQRSEMGSLDREINFDEFKKATMKLKNGKAPGITGVPPDAFKLLNDENLRFVHGFVVDFWNDNADYWQWHIGLGVMVPKKGDLSDPNK